jgi:hypothetical protein
MMSLRETRREKKEQPKHTTKRAEVGSLTSVTLREHSSQYDALIHCRDFLRHGDVDSANTHSNSEVLDAARFDPLDEHHAQRRMVRTVFIISARFFVVVGVYYVKLVAVSAHTVSSRGASLHL